MNEEPEKEIIGDLVNLLADFYEQEITEDEDRLNSRVPHIIQQLIFEIKKSHEHNKQVLGEEGETVNATKDFEFEVLLNPWYTQDVSKWEAGHVAHFVSTFILRFYNPRRPVNMFYIEDDGVDYEPPKLTYQEIFKMKNEFSRFVCFIATKKDSFKDLFQELMTSKHIVHKDKVRDFNHHIENFHYPCDCADIYNVLNDLFGVADDLMKINCADESNLQHINKWIEERNVLAIRDGLEIPLITACQIMTAADTMRSLAAKAIAEKKVQHRLDEIVKQGDEDSELASKAATIFEELRKGVSKPRK
jgi:hypothetical protein